MIKGEKRNMEKEKIRVGMLMVAKFVVVCILEYKHM